jgi:hypothetical protein
VPSIWEGLSHQIYLGSERFVQRMQQQAEQAEDLSEIPRAQRRPRSKPLEYYQNRYRDPRRAMAEAYRTGDYTLKAIGEHFGVHYATVSRAVKAFEEGGG